MQQKIATHKIVCIPPVSYSQADEPESIGALWLLAIVLAIFWVGVGFFADALVAWWLA